MIIQCDQCNTKFRLDDAKVPDNGVKVRCAKCKNIFLVQKEIPAEEPDFDMLLSGLGNQPSEGERGASERDEEIPPEGGGVEEQVAANVPVSAAKEPDETSFSEAGQQGGTEDFGQDFFSSGEETAASEGDAPEPGEYQFGETPSGFEEASGSPERGMEEKEESGFGEFPFDGGDDTLQSAESEAPAAAPETDEFDFGSFDLGPQETSPSGDGGTSGTPAGEIEAEGFDFGEEEAVPAEDREMAKLSGPETDNVGEFVFSAAPPSEGNQVEGLQDSAEAMAATETLTTESAGITAEESTVAPAPEITWERPHEPAVTVSTPEPKMGGDPVIPFGISNPAAEEELPPLAISTRKKGSSLFSIVVTAIAVLIVLAVAGFGFYVFKEGPAAFDKLGLSFLAKWIGMESSDSGNITVKNPQGAFMVNREAGEIFVVSGEAINNYKEPRASIQVKATVTGPNGEVLMQKTAYCGNQLTRDQLTTLPMDKIEEAMGSQFGDALANLGVPTGKSIPFVVVFSKVPKNAGEFSVEVVGSTSATQ